jgi:hypothetical protein
MAHLAELLEVILQGTSDANIPFSGLCSLLKKLGFEERIRGDHHIFTKDGVQEIVTFNRKARKPRSIKSSRFVVLS